MNVKICPECGSTDIRRGKTNAVMQSFGEVSSYFCGKCGFASKVFPEVDSRDVNAVRRELKESKEGSDGEFVDDPVLQDMKESMKGPDAALTDVSYGKFVLTKWWKVVGIVLMVVSIIYFIESFSGEGALRGPFIASLIIFGFSLLITVYSYSRKEDR